MTAKIVPYSPSATPFGSVPGCALAFSNSIANDTFHKPYSEHHFGGLNNESRISAGFTDMVTPQYAGTAYGIYQYLGFLGEAGGSIAGSNGVIGHAGAFSEGGGGPDGNYLRVCYDDAAYSGSSIGSILALGNNCQAKTGVITLNNSNGDQAITGVGFTPDLVIFLSCTTYNADGQKFMYGAADGTNQWVGNTSGHFFDAFDCHSQWWNDKCIAMLGETLYASPTTVPHVASFSSMDVDGFTINLTASGTDSGGNSSDVRFLAIKVLSGSVKVGNATQGAASLSAGFAPDAFVFATTQHVSSGSTSSASYWNLGMTDGTLERCYWAGQSNADNVAASFGCTTKSIRMIDQDNTVLADANVTLTGTGANLTWTTDNGANNLFGWIAFQIDTTTHLAAITTEEATLVQHTSATLNGTVDPNVDAPGLDYWFEWGTTITDNTTPSGNQVGYSPIAVNEPLTELLPDFTYHYRTVAQDDFGCLFYGVDKPFHTPPYLFLVSLNREVS